MLKLQDFVNIGSENVYLTQSLADDILPVIKELTNKLKTSEENR